MRWPSVLVVLFLLPAVTAYTITGTQFQVAGEELEWVQSTGIYQGQLVITLDQPATSVTVDARSMNAQHARFTGSIDYGALSIPCVGTKCTSTTIEFRPGGASSFSLTATITNGSETQAGTASFSIRIDDSHPTLTKLETGTCTSRGCSVRPGINEVRLTYTDTIGTLEKKLLFFDFGGTIEQVARCEGNTCMGLVDRQCQNNEKFSLTLASKAGITSKDDAGNAFQSDIRQNLTCDTEAPTITNLTYSPIPADNKHPLVIRASIKDNTFIKRTWANSSQLGTAQGQCSQDTCTFTYTNLPETATRARILINAEDSAGNTKSEQIEILVLALSSGEEPDLYEGRIIQASPQTVNRAVLQLASANNIPYQMDVEYELKPKSTLARVVQTTTASCEYSSGNATTNAHFIKEIKVADPYLNHTTAAQHNRITLVFDPAQFSTTEAAARLLDTTFTLNCTVKLKVIEGTTLYSETEREHLIINTGARDSPVGELGEAFANKIKKQEDNDLVKFKLLGYANTVMATLSDVCTISSYLAPVQMVGATTQAAGRLLTYTVVLAAVGKPLENAGHAIYLIPAALNNGLFLDDMQEVSKKASTSALNLIQGIVRKSCSFTACEDLYDSPEAQAGFDALKQDLFQGTGFGSSETYASVDNSIIMAIYKQCWPAVLNHVNKWRQIECGYLSCLKDQSLIGAGTSVCEDSKGAQYCMYVSGEVMEASSLIPGARYLTVVRNLGENVRFIAQNALPNFFKYLYRDDVQECVTKPGGNPAGIAPTKGDKGRSDTEIFGCQLAKSIFQLVDQQNINKRAQRFQYPKLPDICPLALCNGPDCGRPENPSLLGGLKLPERPPARQTNEWQVEAINNLETAADWNTAAQEHLRSVELRASLENDYQDPATKAAQLSLIEDARAQERETYDALRRHDRDLEPPDETNEWRMKPGKAEDYAKDAEEREQDAHDDAIRSGVSEAELTGSVAKTPSDARFEAWIARQTTSQRRILGESTGTPYFNTGQEVQEFDAWLTAYQETRSADEVLQSKPFQEQIDKAMEEYRQRPAQTEEELERFRIIQKTDEKYQQEGATRGSGIARRDLIVRGIDAGWISSETGKQAISYSIAQDFREGRITSTEMMRYYGVPENMIAALIEGGCEDPEDCLASAWLNSPQGLTNPADIKGDPLRKELGLDANDACPKDDATGWCGARKAYKEYEKDKRLAETVDFAVRWAWDNTNFKHYLQLKGWPGDLGKAGEALDRYLSSDSWQESICNPGAIPSGNNEGATAYVYTDYGYKPVLNFAVQKQRYNESTWLYSFTLYAGGVQLTPSLDPEQYEFNILFKGSTTKTPGHKQLADGEVFHYSKAFISTQDYAEMCIVFNRDFPPELALAKKEYCRDIRDQGAWGTGDPVARDSSGRPIITDAERPVWNGDV